MDAKKLSKMEKDVLREIGNIGAGNAATSLSNLINKQITMEVPSVKLVTINEMMEVIGGPEKPIAAILFRIKGEVTGTVYFVLTIDEAEELLQQVTLNPQMNLVLSEELDQLTASTLEETANILTGSYLSALADFTQLNMTTSVPYLSIDMAAASLVTGLVELSEVSDYAILIDTKITGTKNGEGAKGHFLLIPDPTSLTKLFASLGIESYE